MGYVFEKKTETASSLPTGVSYAFAVPPLSYRARQPSYTEIYGVGEPATKLGENSGANEDPGWLCQVNRLRQHCLQV